MARQPFNFGDLFQAGAGASPYAGFMSPEMQRQMRGAQMGAIGASLLAGGAPRVGTPPNVGAALSQGFQNATNIGQQSVGNALMLQNYKAQQAATALAAKDRKRTEAFRTAIGTDPNLTDVQRAARAAYPETFADEMAEAAYRQNKNPFKEVNVAQPDGKIQKWLHYEDGRREKIGEPYDRWDPLIPYSWQNEDGDNILSFANRSELNEASAGGGGDISGRVDVSSTPSAAKVSRAAQNRSLETMRTNIRSYRAMLTSYGTSPMGAVGVPSPEAKQLETKAVILQMGVKELMELGALVGADFELLSAMITNPASREGVLTGQEGLLRQLDELEEQLELKIKSNRLGADGGDGVVAKSTFSDFSDEEFDAVTPELLALMPDHMFAEYERERKERDRRRGNP